MRKCELTDTGRIRGNQIAITRSKVSKRTTKFFYPNLQVKLFKTDNLGNLRLKLATRTIRTIDKYDGLENFLINYKKGKLSTRGKQLLAKLEKKGISKYNKKNLEAQV